MSLPSLSLNIGLPARDFPPTSESPEWQLRCRSGGMPKHINSTLAINGLRGHPKLLYDLGHSLIRVESPSSVTEVRRSSNCCWPFFPGQCRRTATEPRLSSKVRVHSAISAAAQASQDKGRTSIEPWILSWYPTCTCLAHKHRSDGEICGRPEVPQAATDISGEEPIWERTRSARDRDALVGIGNTGTGKLQDQ